MTCENCGRTAATLATIENYVLRRALHGTDERTEPRCKPCSRNDDVLHVEPLHQPHTPTDSAVTPPPTGETPE